MSANVTVVKLPSISKEIIEVKKRIQLSEGQRKALFEEIETERKRDSDEMVRLKKEIQALTLSLHEHQKNAPRHDAGTGGGSTKMPASAKMRSVIGHVIAGDSGDKSNNAQDIAALLDLHRIDKTKRLDLLAYKHRQKENKLKTMAEEYQKLLSKEKRDMALQRGEECENQDEQVKELRNRINVVVVQTKEADHVRSRYKEIRDALMEDAAKFESKIRQLEENISVQEQEIERLKKINREAATLKAKARIALVLEEKQVLASGSLREKQANEGKRLLEARASDLEKLERQFYQPKRPIIVPNDYDEGAAASDLGTTPITQQAEDPLQTLIEEFDVLMTVTGDSDVDRVLEKFKAQKATHRKLLTLRKSTEALKQQKQAEHQQYMAELDQLQFAESKDSQMNVETIEELKSNLDQMEKEKATMLLRCETMATAMNEIGEKLRTFYGAFNKNFKEAADANNDATYYEPGYFIEQLKFILLALNKHHQSTDDAAAATAATSSLGIENKQNALEHLLQELADRDNDRWLPQPYNEIVRRTPIPHTPVPLPAAIAGSEDEDEPPTRGFLKRQAQLVIDAKNRRKNMKYPRSK